MLSIILQLKVDTTYHQIPPAITAHCVYWNNQVGTVRTQTQASAAVIRKGFCPCTTHVPINPDSEVYWCTYFNDPDWGSASK